MPDQRDRLLLVAPLTQSVVPFALLVFFITLLVFPGLNWRNKHHVDDSLQSLCVNGTNITKNFFCVLRDFYHARKYYIGVPLQLFPPVLLPVFIRPSTSRIICASFHILYLLLIIRPRMFPDFRGSPQYNTSFFFPMVGWCVFCLSTRPFLKALALAFVFWMYPYTCADDADPHYSSRALCYNGSTDPDDIF